MDNLNELREWESVVAENVNKVNASSRDLLDKSTESKKLMNNLHIVNSEVSESMKVTTDVAQRLSEAVKEIGVTLKLISDISYSINLLSLNVQLKLQGREKPAEVSLWWASEVGNLAKSTQESLKVVASVIECVNQNVREISAQVKENVAKMKTQNQSVANVIQSMLDMTELLNTSANAVTTMGDAHNKQAEVIKRTVSINQDIAESIQNENEQFNSINAMAESNANDTTQIATQAGTINEMVDHMNELLKQ